MPWRFDRIGKPRGRLEFLQRQFRLAVDGVAKAPAIRRAWRRWRPRHLSSAFPASWHISGELRGHHRQSTPRFAKVAHREDHDEFATAEDGVRIAYEVVGEGEPVVLVHGFASGRVQNWRAPGWYQTLNGAGYRVIAMDCRGHGESDKPHDRRILWPRQDGGRRRRGDGRTPASRRACSWAIRWAASSRCIC